MTHSEQVPLRRLLQRQETATLLEKFEALLPGYRLALIDAIGQFFAGTGKWSQAELAELLAQAGDGEMVRTADFLLQPLLAESQFVGVLAARNLRPDVGQESGPDVEQAFHYLHHTLTLLLVKALETRDIVGEVVERYREINLLYQIGETIGGCLDPAAIPKLVLNEAKRAIRAVAGMVLLPTTPTATASEGENDIEVKASFGPAGHIDALHEVSDQAIGRVYSTGRPAIVTPSPADGAAANIGAMLCVPLKMQERTLGVILLGRLAEQAVFTAGDEKLLMALAGQAATAIETARLHVEEIKRQRLEEELAIGHQIQLSLLPEACPVVPGWEFAAVYQAARQVGGDFYDFFELPDEPHRMGLIIADVTGKGVPAALFMASSRSIIRTESMSGRDPATVLRRVNQLIIRDIRSSLFLTAFYATLDNPSGRLTYANGGHDRPLWLRSAANQIESLAAPGFILGAFKDIKLEERAIEVAPGDLLVFYTDGVTEARDARGQLFGEERLRATVATDPNASAEHVLQVVIDAVQSFTGDTPQSDDLTLFVVKRQKTPKNIHN